MPVFETLAFNWQSGSTTPRLLISDIGLTAQNSETFEGPHISSVNIYFSFIRCCANRSDYISFGKNRDVNFTPISNDMPRGIVSPYPLVTSGQQDWLHFIKTGEIDLVVHWFRSVLVSDIARRAATQRSSILHFILLLRNITNFKRAFIATFADFTI